VCLDSNVLVAAFAARGLCADLLRLVIADHDLIVPEVVAGEVRRVLSDKLKVGAEALEALDAVLERCEIIAVGTEPSSIEIRDPDDERVLADAISGGTEILVTGDNDLLDVAGDSPIRIMSPRAFMALVRGSAG
jgi:putative PIN family toxin of toxin-antitoxin system